ncbi:PREDICTED: uncharacterized protein LOC105456033 [Wasmannia auropunctata]|uniref:uncharacterized protein LOC105456033 n=1 Tax=Wasmannia auropunctata TaxID=64793 RepID=UPI0005EF722F|nr:PREDICTED: uncharacterized protein LOC105456033 [Wasmannia auropunctata]
MLSRGVGPEKINNRELWWEGPAWLQEEIEYPRDSKSLSEPPEKRLMSLSVEVETEWDICYRYSSLKRLKMVIAYCRRFTHNCKKSTSRRSGEITVRELEEAMKIIVRNHQKKYFTREIKAMQSRSPISKKSRLLPLNPFIDEEGLLRVGGRLRNAPISYSQKFPVILETYDHLTELIIRDSHLKALHAGPEALLGIIRERYWIVSGANRELQELQKLLQNQDHQHQINEFTQ